MKEQAVNWIRDWFNKNGSDAKAVIGISGGKDSSVVAALCVEALGKDRVIGVMMPDGIQSDIADSIQLCEFLGIKSYTVDISFAVNALTESIQNKCGFNFSDQAVMNTPPRIRMTTLYAIAQCVNGRVANTCNFSETYLGWETKYGDAAGDFAPLGRLTVRQVKKLGRELGLPENLIEKAPSDGLCGQTDEDKFGFSYETLDRWLEEGEAPPEIVMNKIVEMSKASAHKRYPIPAFIPD